MWKSDTNTRPKFFFGSLTPCSVYCLIACLSPSWDEQSLLGASKTKKGENPPDLNTLWMTEHIPCELTFPRNRQQERSRKPPRGNCAPSSAVNIYPWGEGVGQGISLIAYYEKFEDCTILVCRCGMLFIALLFWGFIHPCTQTAAQLIWAFHDSKVVGWMFRFAPLPGCRQSWFVVSG